MKHFIKITLFFWIVVSTAQTKLELTSKGFIPLEIEMPNQPINKLIEQSIECASYYNEKGSDVFAVTKNSLTIEARYETAYYYWNLAVKSSIFTFLSFSFLMMPRIWSNTGESIIDRF